MMSHSVASTAAPRRLRFLVLVAVLLLPEAVWAKPAFSKYFGRVQNGAGYQSASAENHGIAPGSIFVLKGNSFGPEELRQSAMPYGVRLPDEEGGTEVTVRSLETGFETKAWLLHTWYFQVAAILPSEIPLGPAEVTVSYQGELSDPVAFEVVSAEVGLFTVAMTGRGPAVAQNFLTPVDQPLNQLTSPARPGQYLVFWATGLGPISGPDNIAPPAGNVGENVEVEIGGQRLRPDYAGRAPGFPGVDQINVRLPDDGSIPEGCYTEVKVWTGDRVSNTVTIAIANEPGACRHPWDLAPEKLALLDAGGRISAGEVFLWRTWPDGPGPEVWGSASFESLTGAMVAGKVAPGNPWAQSTGCSLVTNGTVGVAVWADSPDFVAFPPVPEHLQAAYLDAGFALLMEGPNGQSLTLDKQEDTTAGVYRLPGDVAPDVLAPGQWRISAPGGNDLGPFSLETELPPSVVAGLPEKVNRATDLTVGWNGHDFTGEQTAQVTVTGYRQETIDENSGNKIPVSVQCRVPADAGSVTFPAELLGQLPASDFAQISVTLQPANQEKQRFSAPGLDYGIVRYSWRQQQDVAIE